ncbi:MAG: glycosyltransferase [Flavobacteriales bacterium]|nr:glycosyltransferase [Flavobacteriales bacterium]
MYLIIGWLRSKTYIKNSSISSTKFSVIIPFRNEEDNIELCIDSLSKLNYPQDLFEIILINDNSEDNSELVVNKKITLLTNFKLLNLTEKQGKKAALELGISKAKYPLITTTDADCTFHIDWLSNLSSFYEETQPNMIIAPVLFTQNNLFSKIQALDFLSLTGTMISFNAFGKNILSNGANLTFEKTAHKNVNGYANIDSIPTGDDILLMQKFTEAYPEKIRLLKSKNGVVYTAPSKNLLEFINQRIRWASKIGSHQSFLSKILGLILFLTNASLLVLLGLAVVNLKLVEFFIVPFALKCIIDFLFLFLIALFFGEKRLLWYIITAEIFNMFMIPIVTIASFFQGYTWKGRQY